MDRRVVVTGLGAVTPVGNDVESTWSALVEGRSGASKISLFDPTPFAVQIAGEVKNFDPRDYMDAKESRRMDRNVQFAVVAAREALRDARLEINANNAEEVGVIVGSAVGGLRTLLEQQKVLEERGPGRINPFGLPMLIADTASGQVAICTGAKGPNMAVVSACATGGHAIGEAAETIRRGDARAVIAGGTEAAIVPLILAGFTVMRVLAPGNDAPEKASRPFDLTRQGFIMSEGATIMVLEDLSYALERGGRIYAELVGYGSSSDAYHLAAPVDKGEGMARAIKMALRKAGVRPEEVDYVNAHAPGTSMGDRLETVAIKTALGDRSYQIPVSSTKSMLGHMMGAAGAVEALACILVIKEGVIPPTINYHHPDPDCDLDCVPNVARQAQVRVAVSNSMGLGGHNSCLVFRQYEGPNAAQ